MEDVIGDSNMWKVIPRRTEDMTEIKYRITQGKIAIKKLNNATVT